MTNSENENSSNDLDERPNYIVEGNVFCCLFCGNKYTSQARCESHIRSCDEKDDSVPRTYFNGVPKFACKVCSRRFKHLVGMKKHVQKHSLPGGFVCRTCNDRFTSEAARTVHQNAMHKAEKESKIITQATSNPVTVDSNVNQTEPFRCKECGGVFRKQNIYQTHIDTKCGTEKQFACDICAAKFLTRNTLYAHRQIHVGVKRHLCDYCGANFLSKGQLKVHERSHTGEKPFKCDICNKGFSYRESLVTHSSMHTGIKPYACQACDLRFSCIGNLIKHRRARPCTCGLPKYQQNYKIAPRASTKIKYVSNQPSSTEPKEEPGSTEAKDEVDPIHEVERITSSPIRDTACRPILESPPTIKKFSETTITDQKPIIYRISEITSIEPQIISLNNVDEIQTLEDNNIIVKMKAEADEMVEEPDSEENLDETTEEYLQYVQSDENSGGAGEDYVTADWYDKGEEIEFVDTENYILEIELHNTEPSEPDTNTMYTIIEKAEDNCEAIIIHTEPEKDSSTAMPVKFGENIRESQEDENESAVEDSAVSSLYKCSFCSKIYIEQSQLKNHLIVEHAQNDGESEDQEETIQHENPIGTDDSDSSLEVHKCPLCPKLYIQPIRLKNHLISEHAAKLELMCQICHKWFKTEEERNKHESNHGEDGTLILKCPTCDLYFGSLDELEIHHNDIHFCYRCPKCSIIVDTMDALKSHTADYHKPRAADSPKKLKCTSCSRIFLTKVALSDHQRSNCGREPLYKCDVCEKSYHSAGSLKTHKTVHSGVLPFKCKYCDKKFRTKGQVKVHERQHSGEKPYKCDWCVKTFAYRESLLTHQSIHTGRKRFMCIPCGTRFSCISNLQSHRKSHKATCGQHPNFTKPIDLPLNDTKMDIVNE